MTITGQALDLADDAPPVTEPSAPGDPASAAVDTAHRLDDVQHHLSHAAGRMKAAKAATDPDVRVHHSQRLAGHLQQALDAGHDLTAGIRAHYPDEAAELEQVKEAVGLARGYELNARSGMISLDLPPGTLTPVPGGVDDHHVTVAYLGPDVDDKAFALACDRARDAAAAMPGPLPGTVGGIGTFPPSDGSDGKVPAWAGVVLPGAERLRSALEDLSASEHPDWHPHVTLAYIAPGEALPAPVPATQVTFTHLSVHRGDDEVVRFPLGGTPVGLAGETAAAQVLGLAKAVSDNAKAATTAHLLETTLHELTHAARHAQAMTAGTPDAEWEFNADHAAKHLDGAAEHAGKLEQHLRDNYPDEAGWLEGLGEVTAGAGDDSGKQHAAYGKDSGGTITAQMAAETVSGQLR